MDARYGERLEALLVEAQVDAKMFEGLTERLVPFVEPFTRSISQAKQRRRAADFIAGLAPTPHLVVGQAHFALAAL